MKMDFTNYSVFSINRELTRDPRAPKKPKNTGSRRFWIAVFVTIGIVVAFGIFEIVMCALAGM